MIECDCSKTLDGWSSIEDCRQGCPERRFLESEQVLSTPPLPTCIYCKERLAVRWDGGQLQWVCTPTGTEPGYVVWTCAECDKGHNYFDLPETLEDALLEIVELRTKLQKLFHKTKVSL